MKQILFGLMLCSTLFAPARAASLEPWTGGSLTPFVMTDINGQRQDLAMHRGKVVLVNFWATWCEPCRLEMPSIQRLREKLGAKDFVVFAVNVDEPEARVRAFIKQTGLDLPVLLDPDKRVTRDWGVRILPVTFVIDKNGRVRYRTVGDLDWSSEQIVGTISQLIGGS